MLRRSQDIDSLRKTRSVPQIEEATTEPVNCLSPDALITGSDSVQNISKSAKKKTPTSPTDTPQSELVKYCTFMRTFPNPPYRPSLHNFDAIRQVGSPMDYFEHVSQSYLLHTVDILTTHDNRISLRLGSISSLETLIPS